MTELQIKTNYEEAAEPNKIRKLRSFMRREGRRSENSKTSFASLFAKYGLLYNKNSSKRYNFADIFGNNNPIVMEIGFGTGNSLFTMAQKEPDLNFIGIEVYQTGVVKFLNKVVAADITNVRVINHDAVEVLENLVAANSLHRVQIFFPDPWPKARHHKRRLIQPEFIELLANKMQQHGKLYMATDWQNYAEHMLKVMQSNTNFKSDHPDNCYAKRPDFRSITKFEQRGISLGHNTYDLCFSRL